MTSDGNWVYVAGAGKVWGIDTTTTPATVLAPISVGSFSEGVAISPNEDFVYVTTVFGRTVEIIPVGGTAVAATIDVSPGNPWGVTATKVGSDVLLYVTATNNGEVTVINASTTAIVTTIDVSDPTSGLSGSTGIAASPDGSNVYVANLTGKQIVAIETATNTVSNRITLTDSPSNVTVNGNGSLVYASVAGEQVAVIDTSGTVPVTYIPLTAPGTDPYDVALTPDGNFLFTTNQAAHTMSIVPIAGGANLAVRIEEPILPPGRTEPRYVAFVPPAPPPPPVDNPPVFDDLEMVCGTTRMPDFGDTVSFEIMASDDNEVTLDVMGLPGTATMNPSLPETVIGTPLVVSSDFSWVATDAGTHEVTFTALDAAGSLATCVVTIEVPEDPDIPFESFVLRFAKVSTRGRFADFFFFRGYFAVDTSDGNDIDLANDPVVIEIESQRFEISPNAFKGYWRGRLFRFKDIVDGAKLLVHITRRGRHGNRYNITVIGWNADLMAKGPMLDMFLQIGNDSGTASKKGRIR